MENRFLNYADIQEYLYLSEELKKIVVVTDPCGSGKTTASEEFIIRNHKEGIIYVAEKKKTIEKRKANLIKKGLDKCYVEAYDSDNQDSTMEVYNTMDSALVTLVTHARMNLDPLYIWSRSNTLSRVGGSKKYLIVDEQPSLLHSREMIIDGMYALLSRIKCPEAIINYVQDAVKNQKHLADDAAIQLMDQYSRYLHTSVSNELEHLFAIVCEHNSSRMTKQLVTINHLLSESDISSMLPCSLSKDTSIGGAQVKRYICRLNYYLLRAIYSVITGRFVNQGFISTIVFSPVIFWKYPAIYLDGSGEMVPYPEDFCYKAPQKVKRNGTVHIVRYDCSNSTREIENSNMTKKSSLKSITTICKNKKSDFIYIVSRKGNPGEPDVIAEKNFVESDSYYNEEKSILGIQNLRNLIQEDLKNQHIDSIILPKKIPNDKPIPIISYYGLAKGSNEYKFCKSVILQTSYYKPNYLIHYFNLLNKNIVNSEEVLSINREWSIADRYQELTRAAIRAGIDTTLFYPYRLSKKEQVAEYNEFVEYLQFKGLTVVEIDDFLVEQLSVITPIVETTSKVCEDLTNKQKKLVYGLLKTKNISSNKIRNEGLVFTSQEAMEILKIDRLTRLREIINSINKRSAKLIIKELKNLSKYRGKRLGKSLILYHIYLKNI